MLERNTNTIQVDQTEEVNTRKKKIHIDLYLVYRILNYKLPITQHTHNKW